MVEKSDEIGKLCRFCLSRDGLIALSNVTSTVVALEDVIYFTGVEISMDQRISICEKCRKQILSSTDFYRKCLSNDVIFKTLVSVVNRCSFQNNISLKCVTTEDAERGTQAAQSTDVVWSDDDMIIMTDSESNDASSHHTVIENQISTTYGAEETEKEKLISYEQSDSVTSDAYDYDYSVPSLNDEAMADELVNETENERRSKSPSVDKETKQSTDLECDNHGIETEAICSLNNEIPPAASESDDSLSSLGSVSIGNVPIEMSALNFQFVSCNTRDSKGSKICPYCGLETKDLNSHIKRSHTREKNMVCPHCLKKFMHNCELQRHINTWHERRIIKTCELCGKGFVNKNSYAYHMTNSHGKSDVYECETCHRKFKSYDGYKKHLKVHSMVAATCKDCGRLYKNDAMLRVHQRHYHTS